MIAAGASFGGHFSGFTPLSTLLLVCTGILIVNKKIKLLHLKKKDVNEGEA